MTRRFERSRLGPRRGRRALRPTCEAIEVRSLMAHLAVSVFGAGVAADATAGPRSDSEAFGLGDSDYQTNPYIAVESYTGAQPSLDQTQAYATADWQNAALQKRVSLVGVAFSTNDAPAGTVQFGTSSDQPGAAVGTPISLMIEPDAGEVIGQPVDVLLESVASSGDQEGTPAQMSYSIGYGDERDNYFGGILDSSGPSTSVYSIRSVTLHERIGDVFDFTVLGTATSPASSLDQSSGGLLSIQVTATLGQPGPLQGTGPSPPSTPYPTSTGALTTVRDVAGFRRDVVVVFSGRLLNAGASSAYKVTSGGHALKFRAVAGNVTSVNPYSYADLHLSRNLRKGQKLVVTVHGSGLLDTAARMVDGADEGVAGSTGVYPLHPNPFPYADVVVGGAGRGPSRS